MRGQEGEEKQTLGGVMMIRRQSPEREEGNSALTHHKDEGDDTGDLQGDANGVENKSSDGKGEVRVRSQR